MNDPSRKRNWLGLTLNPSAPPMITQLMIAPPLLTAEASAIATGRMPASATAPVEGLIE